MIHLETVSGLQSTRETPAGIFFQLTAELESKPKKCIIEVFTHPSIHVDKIEERLAQCVYSCLSRVYFCLSPVDFGDKPAKPVTLISNNTFK